MITESAVRQIIQRYTREAGVRSLEREISKICRKVVKNVLLKWPNDLVLENAKLGGILTEVQQGDGSAITVVTGVGLNIELPAGLDVGVDSEWAQQATDLSHVSGGPPDMEALARAVDLYRGDFLEGFYLREALAFEEWMLAQRARLRALALS